MRTLRTFQNPGEAGFAQSLLEASGIAATLEHETSALNMPWGVAAIRLQVPEERYTEGEQILADHPVRFTASDEIPRIGFWRGGIYGLTTLAAILGLVLITGGSVHVTGMGVVVIFIVGASVGANVPRPASLKTQKPEILQ